jgi:pseudouridylate synthase
MHGRIIVGLTPEEIEILAKNSKQTVKCSRRDLSGVLA